MIIEDEVENLTIMPEGKPPKKKTNQPGEIIYKRSNDRGDDNTEQN